MQETKLFPGLRFVLSAAAAVVVIAGLKAAATVAMPIMLAIFLAILSLALMSLFQRFGLHRYLAMACVLVLVVGSFVGIGALLAKSVNEFTRGLPQYRTKIVALSTEIEQWTVPIGFEQSPAALFPALEPAAFLDLFGATLRGFVNALSRTFVVIVLLIFMIVEAADFRRKLAAALHSKIDTDRLDSIAEDVKRYLGIKTLTSAATGILIGLLVYFMGIDYAVLWALVAFLMNYIPVVGSILASIPALLLAAAELGFAGTAFTALGYLVINLTISNFAEPILMGRHLGLSPLIVFVSLLFWGWVWGPVGMFLSVPLTMVLKILLEHSNEFRWISVLMDNKPVLVGGETNAEEK